MAIHIHPPNFFASRSTTELLSSSHSHSHSSTPSNIPLPHRDQDQHQHHSSHSHSSSFFSSRSRSQTQNHSSLPSRSPLGRLASVSVLAFHSPSSSFAPLPSVAQPKPTANTNRSAPTSSDSHRLSPSSPPQSPSNHQSTSPLPSASRDNSLLTQTNNNPSSSKLTIFSGLIHRSRTRPPHSTGRTNDSGLSDSTRRSTDDRLQPSSSPLPGPPATITSPHQSPPISSSAEDNQQPPPTSRSISSKTSNYFPVLRRMQSRRRERDHQASGSGNPVQSNGSPPNTSDSNDLASFPPSSTPAPRQQRNRRSLSQPLPIPRLVRSATDRLRHHQQQQPHSNTTTNRCPESVPLNNPPAPLFPVLTSLPNSTVPDLLVMPASNVNNSSSSPVTAARQTGPDSSSPTDNQTGPTLFCLRLVPHLGATRSLHFDPIERKIPCSTSLKIGRFTDRGLPPGSTTQNTRIAFKSKVVSRGHADIFTDPSGSFFIKDTKSSSGTFLNHIRLSAPGGESRPFPLRDGDVLQLGVDYQGGTEEIYRCVKMRVELNRDWQRSANNFNQQALSQLKSLGVQGTTTPASSGKPSAQAKTNDSAPLSKAVSDCCICLFGVTVCQALFIAPCSHTYHYKCIRPLLQMHHPGFSCPLCRTFADLEADVETEEVVAFKSPAKMDALPLGDLPPVPEVPGNSLPVSPPLDPATPNDPNHVPLAKPLTVPACLQAPQNLSTSLSGSLEEREATSALASSACHTDVLAPRAGRLGTGMSSGLADCTMLDPTGASPNTSHNSSLLPPIMGGSNLSQAFEGADDDKDESEGGSHVRRWAGSIGSMNCSTEEHEEGLGRNSASLAVKNGQENHRIQFGSQPL